MMAKTRADKPLLPSVFDRLIDEDPGNEREAPKPRAQVLRDMKAAVCRDLEYLLNTRVRAGLYALEINIGWRRVQV